MSRLVHAPYLHVAVAAGLLLAACGGSSGGDDVGVGATVAPTTTSTTVDEPTTTTIVNEATTTETSEIETSETTADSDAAVREGLFVGMLSEDLASLDEGWTDDQIIEFGYVACDALETTQGDIIQAEALTAVAVSESASFSVITSHAWLVAHTVTLAAGGTICEPFAQTMLEESGDVFKSFDPGEVRYLVALHAVDPLMFRPMEDQKLIDAGRQACDEIESMSNDELAARLVASSSSGDSYGLFTTVVAGSADSLCPESAQNMAVAAQALG